MELLILLAVVLFVAAWRWPDSVRRIAHSPRLSFLPASVLANPPRTLAAASVALVVVAVIGAAASPQALADERAAASPAPSRGASSSPTAQPSDSTRPSPSPRPSASAPPTTAPTPTIAPTPLATPAPAFGMAPTGPVQVATVASVTDGDTIRVLLDGQNVPVRYIGIDTPETQAGIEPLGREASDANASLVAGGEVWLEKDVSEVDQYGRLLRNVWVEADGGWLLVNLELVRRGLATVVTFPPDVKYHDALLLPAQREAVDAGLGIWGTAAASPTSGGIVPLVPQGNCEPSYPDFCLPIGTADLDCGDIEHRRFTVLWNVPNPDPHRFDGEGDGIGCES